MSVALAAGGVAHRFSEVVTSGPLLLAAPVALLAGLVSFLSPCVLPLVPGYLSYVTGLSGADLAGEPGVGSAGAAAGGAVAVAARPVAGPAAARRGRVALGGLLFVLGFSAVFVSYGALFGGLGGLLLRNQDVITRVLGVVTVVLGLAFMGALDRLPLASREFRLHRLPVAGLAGAPLLGATFGLGWTPCIGPTLGAVLGLSTTTATAGRGALLAFVYCLGLGIPFIVSGLAFRRAAGAFAVVKRHYALVMRIGGGLLVVIGLLQVTGVWSELVTRMQTWIGSVSTPL